MVGGRLAVEYRLQQFAHCAVFFDSVTQVRLGIDDVVVSSAFPGALDHAGPAERNDDPEKRDQEYEKCLNDCQICA